MASALKRKRAQAEVLETPKRAKSVNSLKGKDGRVPIESAGWEAAFNPSAGVTKAEELSKSNGVNGRENGLVSPEPLDFETFVAEAASEEGMVISKRKERRRQKTQGEIEELAQKRLVKSLQKEEEPWKLSEPIAGRMINADPVFTPDEKFFIVATRSSIQVYSTTNSLLTRSIKLDLTRSDGGSHRIIAYSLSPTLSNILWVACSSGAVFSIDWTTGSGTDQSWSISSTGCVHMTVASMESNGRRRDVVFTTEIKKDGGYRITANELADPRGPVAIAARTIYTSPHRIQFLKTASEGAVIAAASGNRILLGRLRSTDYNTIDKIRYEFRVFESTDVIKSLDIRVENKRRPELETPKKAVQKLPVVDLVVGDVRGVIFLHNDLLAKLFSQLQDGSLPLGVNIIPRKLHWHRQAVHTVKFSLDGNYIISGGVETVLVLWQLDTGKHQFLPHMSATIQNVVVSPTGTSYAIQLSDNSAMVLSTAELSPTANVSGIQTSVIESEASLESTVERVEEATWGQPVLQRTPAVINPADPSRLLVGVGQMQEVRAQNPFVMSNPFLQTFDLASGHNVSRQALTRTNVTNITVIPNATRLSEPRVTHIKISHDGEWLATVDEWTPPTKDIEFLKHQEKDLLVEKEQRREVFLKFWQWSTESDSFELVSRIDAPHASAQGSGNAGRILDLVADPSSLRFSTIGEDGIVRTWSTKTRKRDGVVVRANGKPLRNWVCEHSISLGKPELPDISNHPRKSAATGRVAFSEDGSTLAATCTSSEEAVHLIDPESGIVRLVHTGLVEGEIHGMEFLGQDLIVLSDRLQVFDVVSEDVRLNIKLSAATLALSHKQKSEMIHLAVDAKSCTFAIALPRIHDTVPAPKKQTLRGASSELIVFHQDSPEPQFKEWFPTMISALLPAVGSEGYITLDGAAEIRTVLRKGTQAITSLAQSTSALNLDTVEEASGDLLRLAEAEDEEMEDEQLLTPAPTQDGEEDDDNEFPVVTTQQLASIFDIGPAFALPPMQEMFFQVADLFSGKPIRKVE